MQINRIETKILDWIFMIFFKKDAFIMFVFKG